MICKYLHNFFFNIGWYRVESGSARGHGWTNFKCKICGKYID